MALGESMTLILVRYLKPTISAYPRFINGSSGSQNAVSVVVSGEDNAHVLLNGKDMGIIFNGVLSIKLDKYLTKINVIL